MNLFVWLPKLFIRVKGCVSWLDVKFGLYLVTTLIGLAGLAGGIWQWQLSVNQPTQSSVVLPSGAPISNIVVEVNGAVKHPGVYTLTYGDRVAQAIELAGSFLPDADYLYIARDLSLAESVKDGQKIFIPFATKDSTTTGTSIGSINSPSINLNTSTVKELETLPGIGSTKAERIQAARPITSYQQLIEQALLSEKELEAIRKLTTI